MAMPHDHGIIILTQFHRCQGKHFFDQIITVIIIHLLAHFGCPGSQRPKQRGGNKTLDVIECAAAQNFAKHHVDAVRMVRRVTMSNQHSKPVHFDSCPFLKHFHAQDILKIFLHEKIMIPLTHVDADARFLQIQQSADHEAEFRMDMIAPAKPEIKKITDNIEMVN